MYAGSGFVAGLRRKDEHVQDSDHCDEDPKVTDIESAKLLLTVRDAQTYSSISSSLAEMPQMWLASVSVSCTSEGTK